MTTRETRREYTGERRQQTNRKPVQRILSTIGHAIDEGASDEAKHKAKTATRLSLLAEAEQQQAPQQKGVEVLATATAAEISVDVGVVVEPHPAERAEPSEEASKKERKKKKKKEKRKNKNDQHSQLQLQSSADNDAAATTTSNASDGQKLSKNKKDTAWWSIAAMPSSEDSSDDEEDVETKVSRQKTALKKKKKKKKPKSGRMSRRSTMSHAAENVVRGSSDDDMEKDASGSYAMATSSSDDSDDDDNKKKKKKKKKKSKKMSTIKRRSTMSHTTTATTTATSNNHNASNNDDDDDDESTPFRQRHPALWMKLKAQQQQQPQNHPYPRPVLQGSTAGEKLPTVVRVTEEPDEESVAVAAAVGGMTAKKRKYRVEYHNEKEEDATAVASSATVRPVHAEAGDDDDDDAVVGGSLSTKVVYCHEDELHERFPQIWLNVKEYQKREQKKELVTTEEDTTALSSSSWTYVYPNDLVGGGRDHDSDSTTAATTTIHNDEQNNDNDNGIVNTDDNSFIVEKRTDPTPPGKSTNTTTNNNNNCTRRSNPLPPARHGSSIMINDGVQQGSVSPWGIVHNNADDDDDDRQTEQHQRGGTPNGSQPNGNNNNNNNSNTKNNVTTMDAKYVYPNLDHHHKNDNIEADGNRNNIRVGDGNDGEEEEEEEQGFVAPIPWTHRKSKGNHKTIYGKYVYPDFDNHSVKISTTNNNDNRLEEKKPYYIFPDFVANSNSEANKEDDQCNVDRIQRGSVSSSMAVHGIDDNVQRLTVSPWTIGRKSSSLNDDDDQNVHGIGDGIQRGLMSPWNTNNCDDTLKPSSSFRKYDDNGGNEERWQQRGPVSRWKISEEGKFDSYADYTKYPYPKTLHHKNKDGRIIEVTDEGSDIAETNKEQSRRASFVRSQSVRRFKDLFSARTGLRSVLRRSQSDNDLNRSSNGSVIIDHNMHPSFDAGKTLVSYFSLAHRRLKKVENRDAPGDERNRYNDNDPFSKKRLYGRHYSSTPHNPAWNILNPTLRRTQSDPELDKQGGNSSNRFVSMLNHHDASDSTNLSIFALAKTNLRPTMRRSNSDPELDYKNEYYDDMWKSFQKCKSDAKARSSEIAWATAKKKLRPVVVQPSLMFKRPQDSTNLHGEKEAVQNSAVELVEESRVSHTKEKRGRFSTGGICPMFDSDKDGSLPNELARVREKLAPIHRQSLILLRKMEFSAGNEDGGDFLNSLKQSTAAKDAGAILDSLRRSLMLDGDDDDNDDDDDDDDDEAYDLFMPAEWVQVRGTLNPILRQSLTKGTKNYEDDESSKRVARRSTMQL